VLNVVPDAAAQPPMTEHLTRMLEAARIDAEVLVIVSNDIAAEMRKRSRKAGVVFLGFDPPEVGEARVFSDHYYKVIEHLDTVIMVYSAGDIDLEA